MLLICPARTPFFLPASGVDAEADMFHGCRLDTQCQVPSRLPGHCDSLYDCARPSSKLYLTRGKRDEPAYHGNMRLTFKAVRYSQCSGDHVLMKVIISPASTRKSLGNASQEHECPRLCFIAWCRSRYQHSSGGCD